MKFKTKNIGQRVQLKRNQCLGFKAGDVGTIKAVDGGTYVVHFDIARNGWGKQDLGIPVSHGLFVDSVDLRRVKE